MSVIYVGKSQAKDGEAERLRAFFLAVVMPAIRDSEGCESCRLLQGEDDPGAFVVIEVWDSVEAHRASVKNIAPEQIQAFMQLIEGAPAGDYYHNVALG